MTVTATGGTENVYGVYNAADTSTTTITDNGNITISGKLTVNLSSGSYNRGISSQGGVITLDGAIVRIPGSYYYGIFNKNGNVDIKNNSDVDISSDISNNNGINTENGGNLNIKDSTVKVSADGYAANLGYGKLSIKDSIVDLTRDYNHYRVVNTANDAANEIDLSTSGSSVTLTALGNQSGNSMIGGTVSITTPGTKLEKGKHYPSLGTYDGEYDGSSKTVLQFVHEVAASTTLKGIKIIDKIDGHALTVDVPHAAPNTTETNTLTLVATSVYDDGSGGPVAVNWEITTTPQAHGREY